MSDASSFPDPHATAADPDVDLDLSIPQRIHIIGIGGAAMHPIARILAAMGNTVSGSDQNESAALDVLRAEGIAVNVPHDANALPDQLDVVCVSTAIPATNAELLAARARALPVCSRTRTQAAIAAQRRTIAVAGTHGKTTTSSMLAMILEGAGAQPSFLIGGDLAQVGGGSAWRDTEWFVIEADESDGTFVALPRAIAVVTNVEPDHLEHWGDFDGLRRGFSAFLDGADELRVVCLDDDEAAALIEAGAPGVRTYGQDDEADLRMVDVVGHGDRVELDVYEGDDRLGHLVVPVAGLHNARNATGAIAAAMATGVDFDTCARAIAGFGGVARRFQHRGEIDGITFIDDYAHLPSEVATMMRAARDGEWGRVVAVFQPHRYSRTANLWDTFADAFVGADVLVLTDIYAAGEPPRPGVTGKLIVDAVLDAHPWQRVVYLPRREDVVRYLVRELRPGDLCLTLGAGDLTTVPDEVLARRGDAAR